MKYKEMQRMFLENADEIHNYNFHMLSTLLLTADILLALILVITPFSATKASAVPAYAVTMILGIILYLLCLFGPLKKHILGGIYAAYTVFFALMTYLSVIHSPNQRATVLLALFCLMPFSFVDKPIRMDLFLLLQFLINAILAFMLKKHNLALDDTVNCFCFALLSSITGNSVVGTRLEAYDAQRRLNREKDLDILTGLPNRRKLFESINAMQKGKERKPSGVMMVDIDDFKRLNDRYGHKKGDECLHELGNLFAGLSGKDMEFYRYGGEEFVVFSYGTEPLDQKADKILQAVRRMSLNDIGTISVSIGYVDTKDLAIDYETAINQADKAMYHAKQLGKNQSSGFSPSFSQEPNGASPGLSVS